MKVARLAPYWLWVLLAVPTTLWFGAITAYFWQFSLGVSNDQAVWGQFGDFIGGFINPVVSLIGLFAVVITLRANNEILQETRRQLRAQMRATAEGHYVELELLYAENPSLLRFHEIDTSELTQSGVTSEEFAYLVANLTAGSVLPRSMDETNVEPYEEGSYYHRMFSSAHTRQAWPLLRRMMSETPYRARLQATYQLLERVKGSSAQSVPLAADNDGTISQKPLD